MLRFITLPVTYPIFLATCTSPAGYYGYRVGQCEDGPLRGIPLILMSPAPALCLRSFGTASSITRILLSPHTPLAVLSKDLVLTVPYQRPLGPTVSRLKPQVVKGPIDPN